MDPDDLLHRLAELGRDPPEPDSPCPDRTTLEAYRSGKLSPNDREKMETHLATCARCLDRLTTLDAEPRRMSRKTRSWVFRATRPADHRRTAVRLLYGAVPIAVAGALALMLIPHQNSVPLPSYAFSLNGAVMAARGAGGKRHAQKTGNALPVFVPGSVLTLVAAPELAPPERPPQCAVVLEAPSGRTWRVTPTPSPTVDPDSGSIELRLPLEPLLGRQFGRYRVSLWLFPANSTVPKTLVTDAGASTGLARRFVATFLYQASP